MPRYHYRVSYHNQTRSIRRTRRLIFAVCCLLVVGIIFVAVDVARNILNKTQPSTAENYSAVQAANVNIFRTEFFQFQTSQSWQEIFNESRPGRYVYRSFRGNLVEQDLVIEVNSKFPETGGQIMTNRVLPVRVNADGTLSNEGGVSDNCSTQYKASSNAYPKEVTMHSVTFICNPNSTFYQVVAGAVNGTTKIDMQRKSGGTATYHITYRNFKFVPDSNDFTQLINTFQSL